MKNKLLFYIEILIVLIVGITGILFFNFNIRKLVASISETDYLDKLTIRNDIVIFNHGTTKEDIINLLGISDIQIIRNNNDIELNDKVITNDMLFIQEKSNSIAVLGDVLADGIINIQDAAKAYKALSPKHDYNSFSLAEIEALDANNDGLKNGNDIIKICNRIGEIDPDIISLNKSNLTLEINGSETLIATAVADAEITWTSSDDEIATVDQNGLVTAIKPGIATIIAGANNKVAKCIVVVKEAPKIKLTIPTIEETYTYIGESITPTVTNYDENTMSLSGILNSTNAGNYNIVISIKDKSQYVWSDDSNSDKTLNWTINKASRNAPTVTDYFGIYDGNPHTITVLESNVEYSIDQETWTDTKPTRTEVGETIVYVRIKEDDNYNASQVATGMITISNSVIDIPTNSMCEDITYNGSEQTITKEPDGGYTFSNNEKTNAGLYTVEANLETGYKWNDDSTTTKEITCDIKKKTITKPTIENNSFIYTGELITPTILGYDSNTMSTEGVLSSIVAGSYNIMVNLKDVNNTKWDDDTNEYITLGWEISKAPRNDPTVTNYEGYYDGNPHTINVLDSDVEYSLDQETWTETKPTRTEIGETIVYVRIKEDGNHYASSTINALIKINPIEIQIPTSDICEDITYNGLEQTITKTAGEGYTFSNNTKIDAGTYDVKVNLNTGYIWNDNTTETKNIPCEIKKQKITIPTMDITEYDYTGSTITPTITGYDSSLMTKDGTTSAKNEGSYTITISLKDKDNTKWADNTNQDIILDWYIINPVINKLTINPNGGKYNGTSSSTDIIQETGVTQYSIQNNLTRTGYTFGGFKLSGVGTYSIRDSSQIILSGDSANYLSRGYFKYRTINDTAPTVYNTLKNDTVTLSIKQDSTNSDYGYSLKIVSAGDANPGIGGFYIDGTDDNHAMVEPDSNTSNVDIVRVRAKVPQNYTVKLAGIGNSYTGYGSKYAYETNEGTGDWVNYYFYIYTGKGNSGDYKDRLYVYLDGEETTSSHKVSWYVDSVVRYTYNKDDFYSLYKFGEGTGKLTAQWKASGSRIEFDPNGGTISSGTNDEANFTYNEVYDDKKIVPYNTNNTDYTIYKDGYKFKGWYTSKNNDVQVFNKYGALNASVSGYSSEDKAWIKSNNKTLYAQWEEILPEKIDIDKSSISINNAGKTEILTPTITPSNVANKTVTWTSNKPNVATVDANGKVIAVGKGTATITATTSNGISKKCTVTVTERTNVGIWYSTWYSNEEGYTREDCAIDKQKAAQRIGNGCGPHNFWFDLNINYLPYLSTQTFGYHDTYDESEALFHFREIGRQDIDFLIFDQTNNIHVQGDFIYNRTKAVVNYLNSYNSNHEKIYYVNAVGGNQWKETDDERASVTETEAEDIWNNFAQNENLGKYQYYYNGKPVLVVYGGHQMKSIVENYISNHSSSYLGKYSLFYADNDNTPGYWGWAYTTPVQNDKSMVVMPGWRNNVGHTPVLRQKQPSINIDDGDTYRMYWNAVINRDNYPEFVIINSFNEYAERTAIWIADTSQVTPEVDKWSSPNLYWEINRYYMNYLRTHE